MLAFCTSPSQISLVLGPSDARWLSEEMAFLAELYRSKASSSGRQFGEDHNAALASFLETAAKCQQLSVALQRAVRRGYRAGDDAPPPGQHVGASQANDLPRPALTSPSSAVSPSPAERPTGTKRVRQAAMPRAGNTKKSSSTSGGRRSEGKGARADDSQPLSASSYIVHRHAGVILSLNGRPTSAAVGLTDIDQTRALVTTFSFKLKNIGAHIQTFRTKADTWI